MAGRSVQPRADAAYRGDRIFGHLPAAFIAIGGTQSVLCMVRARTHEHALARLRENAMRYGIADEIDFSRVEVCLGDVGQRNLGLSSEAYSRLAERVDTVFHAAAQINFCSLILR